MELMLHQKQEMKMLMTTQLRQSIELLQYSSQELEQFIRQQELENPLIDLENNNEIHHYFYEKSNIRVHSSRGEFNFTQPYINNFRDDLFELVKCTFPDCHTQKLLQQIIYNLDDYGYLCLDEAELTAISFTLLEIEKGIHLLQQIGPIGVGARNLKECLLLQIQYTYPEEKLARTLVEHYLPLLAEQKWLAIASKMNLSLTKVKELYQFIKCLNPRPCDTPDSHPINPVIPDIITEKKDGAIHFHLNDWYLPKIKLNDYYSAFYTTKCETSKYIQQHYRNYEWLLSSIEQRRNTIIKIMEVIIKKQEAFFHHGFLFLQPLLLKQVAATIGMHESTVSRATKNKMIQTPFGTFSLRTLFSTKLDISNGESVSQTKVKTLLQQIIATENKAKPYSDQKIADYLNAEKGIKVSRRTINKYRDELKIPSAFERKVIPIE